MDGFDLHTASLVPRAFYARRTEVVAQEVLGKVLISRIGDTITGGRVVEAEAYLGSEDPGSHAATKGITKRNSVMYGAPGHAYVYFTYGNHHMLNLVTEEEGVAGAVLVRAIEPMLGIEMMVARRRGRSGFELTNGPGKLTCALGVGLSDNGSPLGGGGRLALYDAPAPTERVETSGRIGLSAGHDMPLRYYLAGNGYVSKGRTGPRSHNRTPGPEGKAKV